MKEAPTKGVRVFAPASVGNVACGFDVFGLALERPGDEVVVRLRSEPGVVIERIEGDGGRLPQEAERNTAGVAVIELLRRLGRENQGVGIVLHKQMPLGSGLGSSGASAVAAAFAANVLLGEPLARRELLPCAMEGERVACGAAHADNVAPSLLGGLVLVRSTAPLDVISIPTPPELYCALVHPHVEVRTAEARALLGREVPLADAITQWANTAALTAGMLQQDYALIGRSLQDVVAEPKRKKLIPEFDRIKAAALAAGALGCSISGSGPSVFALCRGLASARQVGAAMQSVLRLAGVGNDLYLSAPNPRGAEVRP